MEKRKLGAHGPKVSSISLGCMSFAGSYGTSEKSDCFECLDVAKDFGITFLDTAELYGKGFWNIKIINNTSRTKTCREKY